MDNKDIVKDLKNGRRIMQTIMLYCLKEQGV